MPTKYLINPFNTHKSAVYKSAIAPIILCIFSCMSSVHAAEIYVAPTGTDNNSGRQGKPLASIAKAKQLAQSFAGKEAVIVHVADGVYYLPETLIFEPADSGSERYPIIYKAENEGLAVLSGGTKLKLTWSAYKNGIFQTDTPVGLNIDQLFIDGQNQRMARYPNYDSSKKTAAYQGYAADAFSAERAADWADPRGGYIHAMHRSQWGGYHYQITGKKSNNEITYEGGWQNNRQLGMHKDFRMVENIFEELDAPGEWFHDAPKNKLYFKPAKGINLNTAKVEVARLSHLVEFKGTELNPVKHITLQGFVVRHASRTFMKTKEPLLRSDWTIYRGGAFLLTGTENIHILDTEFDQVGGNAIFVNNYNRNVLIKGCHIHDTGASGVAFVGDPDAVRNPLFEYKQTNDLSKIDRTPGPKTNNYPANSTVEDCLIHKIGSVERQPAGVQISMAKGITVRDVSIYDTARAGINIGDGTWGGHLIERVDVFDTVLETHDHGSFNSWGRDRYWRSDQATSQQAIDEAPDLPFLDAVETTTIRNSRWRSDHGWDIDLDDGSTNYDIYNNLMLAGGLKLREGFRRHAWNNIAVHSGLHPHVWYKESGDKVYNNIFMSRHKPARMTHPFVDQVMVDKNFYGESKEKVMSVSDNLSWDKNSAFGDPMFVDPKNGDFRVKPNSPALKIGFKNFPMDQFGVKKASLRAIARTPNLSAPVKTKRKAQPSFTGKWMGASLVNLSGNDFSAFGVSKQAGGVVIKTVPKDSKASKAGLIAGDVIQNVNGQSVSKLRQLNQTLKRTPADLLNLKLVRNQEVIELMLQMDKDLQLKSVSSLKRSTFNK
ncbi:PDZ domain-containing protein [Aliiglaciecola lipolytica]|uniref:PDZ domain-containing protein n=1 Tax=Aliiglaciecola lipolytica TaxID=477689 RepID=UPI001C0875A9|nr:PDZ domain-containing protein [Aliiglaciecola lipolytica]MBU2877941.1 PDZ domain-containing protein [Aliiglaciecola lipolytica]